MQANAEASDEVVDPPKVEEKLGAVPNGLSTDSDVAKRFVNLLLMNPSLPQRAYTHRRTRTLCVSQHKY